jgi:hypothetical protein
VTNLFDPEEEYYNLLNRHSNERLILGDKNEFALDNLIYEQRQQVANFLEIVVLTYPNFNSFIFSLN